ncbi:hypothetical protein [uncultured Enterovirga sp.]|uniref:hypothetical protein n=1 Tax=uncultured Enterovirga sp. TaxID=2026352 RepID=UPI0035C9F062
MCDLSQRNLRFQAAVLPIVPHALVIESDTESELQEEQVVVLVWDEAGNPIVWDEARNPIAWDEKAQPPLGSGGLV